VLLVLMPLDRHRASLPCGRARHDDETGRTLAQRIGDSGAHAVWHDTKYVAPTRHGDD
jgi:hypothetical protein